MAASVREISERTGTEEEKRELEAQFREAEKMKAISTLAGGIAHQFNNSLMWITGNIELLEMDFPDDEEIHKYVAPMKDSVRRMAHLSNQLLAYAQGGKYQPKIILLSDFVEDTLSLLRQSIDPAIRIETDLQADAFYIEGDVTQMQMVLSAVVTNAAEAIEGENRIRIITRGEEVAKNHSELKPGRYVCLMIDDNGKGMDEETRSRIFEPFFSTKFQGRGLGMAAVYGIIKNHNGWISVDSELGKGTVAPSYSLQWKLR